MGPGYDLYFDGAEDECYSDDLWLMERRAAAFDGSVPTGPARIAPHQQREGER